MFLLSFFLLLLSFSCSNDSDLLGYVDDANDRSELGKYNNGGTSNDGMVTRSLAFSPTNDAYFQDNRSYDHSIMRIEENIRTSFLMFDLSSINGLITDVSLQFTVDTDEGNGNLSVYRGSSANWTEDNLSSSNVPSSVAELGTINKSFGLGSTVNVPLMPSEILSEKTTIILKHAGGNDFAVASKEHPARIGPKLIVTYTLPEDVADTADASTTEEPSGSSGGSTGSTSGTSSGSTDSTGGSSSDTSDPSGSSDGTSSGTTSSTPDTGGDSSGGTSDSGSTGGTSYSPGDYGSLKAFPTAYGAGAYATGGRGGAVYVVTNLNNSGSGSFREAAQAPGARTIVFAVSGVINLTSPLTINRGDLTIAGQTAPAGGITLTGKPVYVSNADNVIIRYIRIRPVFNRSEELDAFAFSDCRNVIIDHVSVSWGSDEVVSFTGNTQNVSIQRLLIAEGKTGSILGDSNDPGKSRDMSIHNSLYYNISHRFPNPNSNGRIDVINNVVHNWNYRLMSTKGSVQLNHINNYYQAGCLPGDPIEQNLVNRVHYVSTYQPSIYTSGNLIMDGWVSSASADNWPQWQWWNAPAGKSTGDILTTDYRASSQHSLLGSALPVRSATDAFNSVVSDVGANKRLSENGDVIANSDSIDEMYLSNVANNRCDPYEYYGSGYGTPPNYDSFPHYTQFHNSVSSTPLANGYQDSDNDGMPDAWEAARGQDPYTRDNNEDPDGNGYTNLEEFLNLVDL